MVPTRIPTRIGEGPGAAIEAELLGLRETDVAVVPDLNLSIKVTGSLVFPVWAAILKRVEKQGGVSYPNNFIKP